MNTSSDKVEEQEEERVMLDPRGLVHNDMEYIKRHIPQPGYIEGDTLADVAYKQGMHDLIRFIETNVIGRRFNNGPLALKTKKEKTT